MFSDRKMGDLKSKKTLRKIVQDQQTFLVHWAEFLQSTSYGNNSYHKLSILFESYEGFLQ